ncbi:MAG: carboxypeptidase regulatory-like domain-containing protein [Candidatus Eremiobacterota bacterium]
MIKYVLTCVMLMLILSLTGCFYSMPEEFSLGSIGGIVQDNQFKGIEGVQVSIQGTDKTTYTDATGAFFLSELEPGNYTVTFFMTGYQTQQKNVTVQKGQSRSLVVDFLAVGATPGGTTTSKITDIQNQAVVDPSLVHTLYVAHAGISDANPYGNQYQGGMNIDGSQTNPAGNWSGDATSGIDTSTTDPAVSYVAYLKGADPLAEAYSKSLPPPSPENLMAFQQFAKNKKNNITVVDSGSRKPSSIIEWNPGVLPLYLDVSDNGILYIGDSSNIITAMNTGANNAVIGQLAMGQNMVNDLAVGNSGARLFCALAAGEPAVAVIDCAGGSMAFLKNIPLGRMKDGGIGQPWGIGTHRNGNRAYVTLGTQTGGEIVCIDTMSNSVMYHVTVGQNPFGVAVTPDGKKVYVANQNSGNVSVVDTGTKQVVATIPTDFSPVRVAITPDGKKALVTNKGTGNGGSVSVIDTMTNSVIGTLPMGKDPIGISISRDGKMAYVANSGSDTITMINLASNSVMGSTLPFPKGKPMDVVVVK